MSKLTDLELHSIYSKAFCEKSSEGLVTACVAALRAIESAATEPLLQRIAELEQRNSDLHEDVQRFKKHALNEKAARLELERQLEEARKDAERLDYIQKNARSDPKMDGNHVWWPTTLNQAQNLKGPTIRAAIDAAMQKGQS